MNDGGVVEGLRLSVLDQSPVPAGSTPGQALENSIGLARLVEGLGYARFWMSEHHAMDTLACTAPEVMLARIGAAAAVEFGLPYSFAHFFSPVQTRAAIETYRRSFTASAYRRVAEATVAVGVICAETQEEAEFLSSSVRLLQRRIRQGDRRPVASPEDAVREMKLLGAMPMEEDAW